MPEHIGTAVGDAGRGLAIVRCGSRLLLADTSRVAAPPDNAEAISEISRVCVADPALARSMGRALEELGPAPTRFP